MYEIRSGVKTVNGKEIETWTAEFFSANVLEAEVGTNGYQGGDTGHGGRTYFRLKDLGGTDMFANTEEGEVTIAFGGDTELNTFIQSLEFALKVLKEQSNEVHIS